MLTLYFQTVLMISWPKLNDFRHSVGAILSVMPVLIKWENLEFQTERSRLCKDGSEGISHRWTV